MLFWNHYTFGPLVFQIGSPTFGPLVTAIKERHMNVIVQVQKERLRKHPFKISLKCTEKSALCLKAGIWRRKICYEVIYILYIAFNSSIQLKCCLERSIQSVVPCNVRPFLTPRFTQLASQNILVTTHDLGKYIDSQKIKCRKNLKLL